MGQRVDWHLQEACQVICCLPRRIGVLKGVLRCRESGSRGLLGVRGQGAKVKVKLGLVLVLRLVLVLVLVLVLDRWHRRAMAQA